MLLSLCCHAGFCKAEVFKSKYVFKIKLTLNFNESTPEIKIITQVVQQVSGGLGIGSFCTQTKYYNTIQSENIGVHPREYISFYANFISQINRNHMFHANMESFNKNFNFQCMYQPINLFSQIYILMNTEVSYDLYIIP